MVENRGAILRAIIRPLPIASRRIVVLPKHVEQVVIGDLGRIVLDLHNLRVAGPVGADVLVRRIFQRSAGVTDGRVCYAFDLAKRRFDAPETTGTESGFFGHDNSFQWMKATKLD